jgi:DNA-binding transcriptional LysR family regulator
MDMDWDRLRIFHIVVQAGSLTDAGHALNVSQSAVSRQISSLEKSIGVSLFNRHPRGLILTEQGEHLFKITREMFAQVNSISSIISESRDGLSGTLKVATTVAIGSVWLASRLKQFMQTYPKLKLNISLTDGDVDFTMREADVAINYHQSMPSSDVVQKPLGSVRMGIYASKEYVRQYGIPTTPEELDNHRLIVFGETLQAPAANVSWLLRFGAKPGTLRVPFLSINNAYGMLQAVKGGIGIAILADFLADDHDDIIELFADVQTPTMTMYFTYPSALDGLGRIRALYEFTKKELGARKANNKK